MSSRDVRHLCPIPSRSRMKMAYIPGDDRADPWRGCRGGGVFVAEGNGFWMFCIMLKWVAMRLFLFVSCIFASKIVYLFV